ncbi:MerR family transcriptional regulator [Legionella santicrucis]|uniref:MerR family transcriptional regulator n=1 Tax=Legionella santicrucis TaxID=45074 RepID=A0A0W0YUV1_9GAMM|nr:MerR family DNA-binding transcriptional regulator [Legionella santicrucis]KTD60652.1 MerR family transcriptional regulator [Legionella santicrucis]
MNNKTIGEFAKLCGVGVETIRYYQRQGILSTHHLQKNLSREKSGVMVIMISAVYGLFFQQKKPVLL